MKCACSSELMEVQVAAENFVVTLLHCGIWLGVTICDGEVTALEEIMRQEVAWHRPSGQGVDAC